MRTDLQIIMQALVALQLEIRVLSLGTKAPADVCAKVRKSQSQAKELMQSAEVDADIKAHVEATYGPRTNNSGQSMPRLDTDE